MQVAKIFTASKPFPVSGSLHQEGLAALGSSQETLAPGRLFTRSEAPRELSITRQSTFSARRVCQLGDGSLLSALFTLYRQSCDPGLLSKAYPSCTSLLSHSSSS